MKALHSGSTRVDHQHSAGHVLCGILGIWHYTENMAVATDKDIRAVSLYELAGIVIVVSGVTADVGHQYTQTFPFEILMDGIIVHQTPLVAISHYAYQRFEIRNLGRYGISSAKISGMPDLIAGSKELLETGVKEAVCIRYDSYFHRLLSFHISGLGVQRGKTIDLANRKKRRRLCPKT